MKKYFLRINHLKKFTSLDLKMLKTLLHVDLIKTKHLSLVIGIIQEINVSKQ